MELRHNLEPPIRLLLNLKKLICHAIIKHFAKATEAVLEISAKTHSCHDARKEVQRQMKVI